MLETLLGSSVFHGLMKKHIQGILELLLQEGTHFSILTNIADVHFNPELPEEISKNFKPITMFFLAGYTFESIQFDSGTLSFEAGFGNNNFGSIVSLPVDAILQIIVEEIPIFINLSTPAKLAVPKNSQDKGLKRSMSAFMSNPDNQKLIKK